MKVSKFKVAALVMLMFTVVVYDYQFLNIPTCMFLNAYSLGPLWRTTEFHITLPSLGIPHEYWNVTDDDCFRARVIDYVIACDTIRTGMVIKEYDTPYDWLKNAVESPKGYDMTIDYYNETYFLQVRYYPDFQRTHLEYGIFWTINIIIVVVWGLFAVSSIPKMKAERKVEKNESV